MHVRDFIGEMERLAPPDLAEDFDAGRIGLVVEGRPEIQVICCALDATPAVVKAAADLNADMLVVHHTPLWTPVTSLTGRTASLMKELLSAGMNLYVMHTNFDRADEGVNDALAELLSLTDRRPLSLGLIGTCPLSLEEISRRLGGNIRAWGTPGPVRQLAIVAGSGFDPAVMAEAQAQGADTFLSAELKHSVARSAPLPCIEATHYALEAPAMKRLAAREGWHYLDDPPVLSTIP
ncbi:Nif3-like dinuclear metal center hexameric protein [Methanoregula sp.]|uniref:Nif3-like dinuclear metal center hexameric protein n=1 Tax=Methanoregula sp. TaxID=2052170 RepID=UPI003C70F0C6